MQLLPFFIKGSVEVAALTFAHSLSSAPGLNSPSFALASLALHSQLPSRAKH